VQYKDKLKRISGQSKLLKQKFGAKQGQLRILDFFEKATNFMEYQKR
jgi:hypothetical protein